MNGLLLQEIEHACVYVLVTLMFYYSNVLELNVLMVCSVTRNVVALKTGLSKVRGLTVRE